MRARALSRPPGTREKGRNMGPRNGKASPTGKGNQSLRVYYSFYFTFLSLSILSGTEDILVPN
jgi:hypothetical protein